MNSIDTIERMEDYTANFTLEFNCPLGYTSLASFIIFKGIENIYNEDKLVKLGIEIKVGDKNVYKIKMDLFELKSGKSRENIKELYETILDLDVCKEYCFELFTIKKMSDILVISNDNLNSNARVSMDVTLKINESLQKAFIDLYNNINRGYLKELKDKMLEKLDC